MSRATKGEIAFFLWNVGVLLITQSFVERKKSAQLPDAELSKAEIECLQLERMYSLN
jgi:hypothetical protein